MHVSRYASYDVVYLWAVPTLLAVLIAWERYHQRPRIAYAAIAALCSLLYVPGIVWLVLAGILLQPHLLKHSWQSAKNSIGKWLLVLTPLIALTPLLIAFVRTPSLIQTWLGLPLHFGTPSAVMHGLLHDVSFFVYRGPATPEVWLARAPILSFFSIVMALLGALFYLKHRRAPRTRFLMAFFVIGGLLFALGGPVTISILVPLVYLLVAAGFGYLLHEWLHVFPRNPLARSVGFGLLGLAVLLTCIYEVKSYYVAWPHNTATQAAFHSHT